MCYSCFPGQILQSSLKARNRRIGEHSQHLTVALSPHLRYAGTAGDHEKPGETAAISRAGTLSFYVNLGKKPRNSLERIPNDAGQYRCRDRLLFGKGIMTIRLARIDDLEVLHGIVQDATRRMVEQGIAQWDEIYPNKEIILQDIERQECSIIEQDGGAVGIIAINEDQPPEYAAVTWTYAGRALVVHRLTIAPAHQRRGLATRLMDLAEDIAATRHYDCVRLDAFTRNPAAIALYERRGYKKAGIVRFRKGDFYCYEKAITVE